jgi:integrase
MRSRDRVLSDDELAPVWCAACAMPAPFGSAIRLLILTGARREEIGRLTWKEIQGDTIRLTGERTKTDTAHAIPLSECARNILGAVPRIGRARFVFTTTGETPVSGWSKAKSALDVRTGALPGWRIHDLRRTIATGLQRLGFKLEIIEAVLGHTSGSRAGIVGVYQRHSFIEEKREALEAWSRYVTLLARPMLWAKVRKYLDKTRERDREFCQMIKADHATWTKYVIGIARPEKPRNVTALKRRAR